MKIKNGFISNSSAASFVVSKDVYPVIWDVALAMIPLRNWGKLDESLIVDIKKYKHEKLVTKGILFSSCNFDTYIHDVHSEYWVATCNNHAFYKLEGFDMPTGTMCNCHELSCPMCQCEKEHWIKYCMRYAYHFERVGI
jgi:hypothetical protein